MEVYYEQNCGITGLRKEEKISIRMLPLVATARLQPIKTLKHWRKYFWIANVFGMTYATAKIVARLLNFEQKQRCMDIVQEMLSTFNDDVDLLKKVITGNQLSVFGYDTEIKVQSFQWKLQKSENRKKNQKFGQI